MILFVTARRSGIEITRRLHNFANLSIQVTHFCFAREGKYPDLDTFAPWRIVMRLAVLVAGIIRLRKVLRHLTSRDIVLVYALDTLVATIIARVGLKSSSPLACQILDVHSLLLEPGPWRAMLRRVERWALSHIDLLIVPNVGNITRYYAPVVGFCGVSAVVHNKLPSGEVIRAVPPPAFRGTWVVGWFGSLRCSHSLMILCRAAQKLGDKVEFRLAGVDKFGPGLLRETIAPFKNIRYLGPFSAPQDAAGLFQDVHVAFALHFVPPEKSRWALPVRILEAGAFGRPSIARGDTDAGKFVREHAIGWTIAAPHDANLAELLASLAPDAYERAVTSVRAQSNLFVGDDHLADALSKLGL